MSTTHRLPAFVFHDANDAPEPCDVTFYGVSREDGRIYYSRFTARRCLDGQDITAALKPFEVDSAERALRADLEHDDEPPVFELDDHDGHDYGHYREVEQDREDDRCRFGDGAEAA